MWQALIMSIINQVVINNYEWFGLCFFMSMISYVVLKRVGFQCFKVSFFFFFELNMFQNNFLFKFLEIFFCFFLQFFGFLFSSKGNLIRRSGGFKGKNRLYQKKNKWLVGSDE